jgi:hypothetical protein
MDLLMIAATQRPQASTCCTQGICMFAKALVEGGGGANIREPHRHRGDQRVVVRGPQRRTTASTTTLPQDLTLQPSDIERQ